MKVAEAPTGVPSTVPMSAEAGLLRRINASVGASSYKQSRVSQGTPELSGGHTDDLPEKARKVTLIRKAGSKGNF